MLDFRSVIEFYDFAVTESLLLLFRKFFAIYSNGDLYFFGFVRHKLLCEIVVFNDDFLLFVSGNLLFFTHYVLFSGNQCLFLVVAQWRRPLWFTIDWMYVKLDSTIFTSVKR